MAGIKTLLHLLGFSSLLTMNWVLDWLFNPFAKSNNYSIVFCLGMLLTSTSIILRPDYGPQLPFPCFGYLYGYSLSSCSDNKGEVLMQRAVTILPSFCSQSEGYPPKIHLCCGSTATQAF